MLPHGHQLPSLRPCAGSLGFGALGTMTLHPYQTAIALLMSFVFTGCARFPSPRVELHGTNSITIHYSDNYGLPRYAHHPIIKASINGVTGPFVIDTGATIPILTMPGEDDEMMPNFQWSEGGGRRCGAES